MLGKLGTALVFLFSSLAFAVSPPLGVREFLDQHPSAKAMYMGQRMVALYATEQALVTSDNPTLNPAITDALADGFVQSNAGAFGIAEGDLRFEGKVVIGNGKTAIYRFRQFIEGLPVHSTTLRVPIHLGTTERISFLGIRLVPMPSGQLPVDSVDAEDADDSVLAHAEYSLLTAFTQPERVVYEDAFGILHRAWRLSGNSNEESYLFFVDTNTGALVGVQNEGYHADLSGHVTGSATPCFPPPELPNEDCPTAHDPVNNPPQQIALPGIQVTAESQSVLTDSEGDYSITGLSGDPVQVEGRLIGQWVTVCNAGGSVVFCPENPNNLVAVETGTPPGPVDLLLSAASQDPLEIEYATAQVNAFLVTEGTHNFYDLLLPATFTLYDEVPVKATVNILGNDAISYGRLREMRFAQSTAFPTANTAYSTYISHEYGHLIVYFSVGDCASSAFHEGMADALSAFYWRTPAIGLGVTGVGSYVRHLDEQEWQLNDPSCGGVPHCLGLALAGALWDMRAAFIAADAVNGEAEANQLLADVLFYTDGQLDQSLLGEILDADDNDGDPMTESPHYDEIVMAFSDHGWEPPTDEPLDIPDIWVSWEPAQLLPPIEPGVDYIVDKDVVPWNVTLRTTQKGGVNVLGWKVGRDTLQNGIPCSLGSIRSEWQGPALSEVTVEVGVDVSHPLASVDEVQIDRPTGSPTAWSSVHLKLVGNLLGPVSCEANQGGEGGRLWGSIAGARFGALIDAFAIGSEAGQADVLNATVDTLGRVELATLPVGSQLRAKRQRDAIVVAGTQNGLIDIDALESIEYLGFLGSVQVQGPVSLTGSIDIGTIAAQSFVEITDDLAGKAMLGDVLGSIRVHGDMSGAVTIVGDVTGEILADADGDNAGSILGDFYVDGSYDGNICAENLPVTTSIGISVPSNVDVHFGCNGRICGVAPGCAPQIPNNEASTYLHAPRSVNLCPTTESCPNAKLRVTGTGFGCSRYVQANGTLAAESFAQALHLWGDDRNDLYLNGAYIVPDTDYLVEILDAEEQVVLSRTVTTRPWGETDGVGIIELGDIDCTLVQYTGDDDPATPKCTLYSADIAPCLPDGIVELTDVLSILDAYSGETYPCAVNPCPPPGGPMVPGGGEGGGFMGPEGGFGGEGMMGPGGFPPQQPPNNIILTAAPGAIIPGATKTITAKITGPENLRGYQLAPEITGGITGTLTVDSMEIDFDSEDPDFVFAGMDPIPAFNQSAGRLMAALTEGGVYVGEEQKYLATFVLRASPNASGTFTVKPRLSDTSLRDANNQSLTWTSAGTTVTVTVP